MCLYEGDSVASMAWNLDAIEQNHRDNVASMAWNLDAIEQNVHDVHGARAGKVDLAMVQAEEEQARIPVTYGRRSRRSMSSVNSGVTEEPSLIHEQPSYTGRQKRRMLLRCLNH